METKQITKEQFEAYEKVRVSGVTNMFMVSTVCDLSGLDKETIVQIMSEYVTLHEKYMDSADKHDECPECNHVENECEC